MPRHVFGLLLVASPLLASADAVVDWNIIAGDAVTNAAMATPTANRALAIAHVAASHAVAALPDDVSDDALDAARTGATSYLVTAGSAPASIQQMVGAQLLTLPPDAAVDATGTVASGPNWALVMRPGPSPTFSCDLVDRTYDATARSTPDLAGYLRVGSPTAVDLVAGVVERARHGEARPVLRGRVAADAVPARVHV